MATEHAAISASQAARRYDIDALRVFAFGLLIFFHVGMFYVLDWGWHVKSTYLSKWLQFPILHQTIIVVIGFNLSRLQLGPVVEPALVLFATIAGCFLLHEFVIRRVAFLRPFFGLKL